MNNTLKKLTATAMAVATMLSVSATGISADEWIKTDTGYKYELDDGSYQKKSSWVTIGKDTYYINSKGVRATGSLAITKNGQKKYYYFDKKTGKMRKSAWIEVNGVKYFYRSNGERATGMSLKISGKTYKFDETGAIIYVKSTTKRTNEEIPKTVTFATTVVWERYNTKGKLEDSIIYSPGTPIPTDLKDYLTIYDSSNIKDFDNFKYFSNIEWLNISYYNPYTYGWDVYLLHKDKFKYKSNLTNLDFLNGMDNLKTLKIYSEKELQNIDGISSCTKLQEVSFDCCKITSIKAMSTLVNLKKFTLDCSDIKSLDGVQNWNNIELIYIECCDKLKDISALKELKGSTNGISLTFDFCESLTSIDDIKNMINLKSIRISDTKIKSLEPLVELINKKGSKLDYVILWSSLISTPAKKDKDNIALLEDKGVEVKIFD